MQSVENVECRKYGVSKTRRVENEGGVSKMRSVENAEYGKCTVWKMRSVEKGESRK